MIHCERCYDTGRVTIWANSLSYAGPGEPPDDASGVIGAACLDCPPAPELRHKAPPGQCTFCDREREAGNDHHPSHDASDCCESGRHNHCTCDACF